MTELFQRVLPTVQKPARYTGGEFNEIQKDPADVRVNIAFCFPDTYEIGMSNLGMRILYGVMNQMDGVWCQRVFAPWGDMEQAMRQHNLPLWALESRRPVKEFDMIAFTIGYEMCYTNILNMLSLAGVPLRSADRTGLNNIVFAGADALAIINPPYLKTPEAYPTTEVKSPVTSPLVPYASISQLFFPDILEREIVVITGP